MTEQKRFQLVGYVRPTAKPKERDRVRYEMGSFDTLEEAESYRREMWRVGWGSIAIIDLRATETKRA